MRLLPHAVSLVLTVALLSSSEAEAESIVPPDMTPWFTPPAEFTGKPDGRRSPLLFDDGKPVATAAAWQKRREEIRRRWHEIMGPWPDLIAAPKIEVLDQTERDGFVQKRIRVEIAPGQTSGGFLLIPKTPRKAPAVLVPFYDPETSVGLAGKPFRDFAYQLARRGFVTLSIGSPGGDARLPDTGKAACQPLSFLAYVAANCANALANLPEVDPARIGVLGHSYGGK